MRLHLPGGGSVFAYPKDEHQPTTFTLLNFLVEDIDEAVDDLTTRGVQFERYEESPQTDPKSIPRGRVLHMGPDIAWFHDLAGNTLAVLQLA